MDIMDIMMITPIITVMAITLMAPFPSIMISMIFIISIMMVTLVIILVIITLAVTLMAVTSVVMAGEGTLDRHSNGRAFPTLPEASRDSSRGLVFCVGG
jgi:hypothetical protein